jgi:hypothetical protein
MLMRSLKIPLSPHVISSTLAWLKGRAKVLLRHVFYGNVIMTRCWAGSHLGYCKAQAIQGGRMHAQELSLPCDVPQPDFLG